VSLYLLMKLFHVLAAFWMVSGVVGRDLTLWWAGKAKDVQAIHALLQISEFFERYAVIPVSIAVLIFGLIVTWMQKWPLFGSLQGAPSNWLLVSFILFVGMMGLIAPLGLVARRKERERAMRDKVVIRFRVVELIFLLVIIILMVTKPF
jgi:uncharacterized membrane protein